MLHYVLERRKANDARICKPKFTYTLEYQTGVSSFDWILFLYYSSPRINRLKAYFLNLKSMLINLGCIFNNYFIRKIHYFRLILCSNKNNLRSKICQRKIMFEENYAKKNYIRNRKITVVFLKVQKRLEQVFWNVFAGFHLKL